MNLDETAVTTAVYAAEQEWRDLCVETESLSEPDANDFGRTIYEHHATGLYREDAAAYVVRGDTTFDAHANDEGVIVVGSLPVERATILHECVHVLLTLHGRHDDDDDHGGQFRAWHLRLVRWGYGDDAADLLADLYHERGLDVPEHDDGPPRLWP